MKQYLEFIEPSGFTRRLPQYLGDDDYRLQSELASNPELGDLMPATGGFRKMRWADARRGKGRKRWIESDLLLPRIRQADLVDDAL